MKYNDMKARVKELRDTYKKATEEEKTKITEEGKKLSLILKTCYGCYICDEPILYTDNRFPFCSDFCHEIWKKDNPIMSTKSKHTVLQAIEKLKLWGKEVNK